MQKPIVPGIETPQKVVVVEFAPLELEKIYLQQRTSSIAETAPRVKPIGEKILQNQARHFYAFNRTCWNYVLQSATCWN